MSEQRTFASLAWQAKSKVTRRERFLAEMDAVIPWARLLALIEPHYPKEQVQECLSLIVDPVQVLEDDHYWLI